MPGIYSCFLLFHFYQNLTNPQEKHKAPQARNNMSKYQEKTVKISQKKKKGHNTLHTEYKGEIGWISHLKLDFHLKFCQPVDMLK